ncbi:hypothetical protein ACFE04_002438 [Oxalis oulophora]
MEKATTKNPLFSNLLFSKVLTKPDFFKGPFLTTEKFLDNLKPLNYKVNPTTLHIEVVDDDNHIWVLGIGWRGICVEAMLWLNFIHAKKLRVGDLIQLYTIDPEHAGVGGLGKRFRITIKKPIGTIRLFGQNIGYYSPP